MSRPPRNWVENGIYHLTMRGNNRQAIYFDAKDFQQYLLELYQVQGSIPFRLMAYALMPNHVHLLMGIMQHCPLSVVMQLVATQYSKYFNSRHKRSGHLYQGRFWSNAIHNDSYLLEVSRYIHLNPYKARLVKRPGDYPWSSYGVYLGINANPYGIVDPNQITNNFGMSDIAMRDRYRQFVEVRTDKQQFDDWLGSLHARSLIPPARWLKKVPGTMFSTKKPKK